MNSAESFIITAIVINRQPFRERDSRVTIYAKDHGLMSLIARGTKNIKSKLAGHIEPANLIKAMVIRGRQLDYLGSTDSLQVHKNLKADFDKTMALNLGLKEFARTVKEGVVDAFLFNLLYDYILALDKPVKLKSNPEFFSSLFILKMISHLGYRPELYCYMDDKKKIKPGNNCFSLEKGGLISNQCVNDEYHFKVSDDCIKILRLIIKEDIKYLSKIKTTPFLEKEIARVIKGYYNYYLR
ncbi:DNA repair protein RecO [Candidatus Parcubacteria bacterium]|nr:DNA repair protein RecO [Candidatus Parcubacteria bacterium]